MDRCATNKIVRLSEDRFGVRECKKASRQNRNADSHNTKGKDEQWGESGRTSIDLCGVEQREKTSDWNATRGLSNESCCGRMDPLEYLKAVLSSTTGLSRPVPQK